MRTKGIEAYGEYTQVPQEDSYPEDKSPLYNSADLPPRNLNPVPSNQQPGNYHIQGPLVAKFEGVPVNIICPNCNQNVVTIVKKKHGAKTAFAVIGVGIIFWPLMWVPLVTDYFKKSTYFCPSCNTKLGKQILVQVQTPQ
ncbi:hypothetical protein BB558_003727 [Smittium angustum]|uniref:LITAF domain-containing protein n=1 Tax=Smittium angustum TaxID=133377 RepID=A0A2U1J589_SMIAN|nr:hypothetical protein BB558_003727 [Smittium angustum]